MYLKHIRLAGFKSFVDPTTIPIGSHVNAIVGPNGCGKSNVADAIRWVIGEMSAKQLRGESMSDVIFNGTSSRKPVGQASVELHFDNSDSRLTGAYAQYTDIVVRREVSRGDQSTYFINNMVVRRRDVLDIFLGTGLGPRSYAIIEQGTISHFIEARPEELRVYLEEVAGISKYKERRRETENRLTHTQDNLDRLNDIRSELEKQLRHLQRQAKAAERYRKYQQEEQTLAIQIKALQWKQLEEQFQSQSLQIEEQTIAYEKQRKKYENTEQRIKEKASEWTVVNQEYQSAQENYYETMTEKARLEQRLASIQEQREQWETELKEVERSHYQLHNNIEETQPKITVLKETVERLTPESEENRLALQKSERMLAQIETERGQFQREWDSFQSDLGKVTRERDVAATKIEHHQQQREELKTRFAQLQGQQQSLPQTNQESDIVGLNERLALLREDAQKSQEHVSAVAAMMTDQRKIYQADNQEHRVLQQKLKELEMEYRSEEALQQAMLNQRTEESHIKQWLTSANLDQNPRLGGQLTVEAGWELAVETVLRRYFDAVCIDDFVDQAFRLSQIAGGQLTLVTRQQTEVAQEKKLDQLISRVSSDWALDQWLSHIYVADSLEEAQERLKTLKDHESVITQEGLWLAPKWAQMVKPSKKQGSFLLGQRALKQLKEKIEQQRTLGDEKYSLIKAAETELENLEKQREQAYSQNQECRLKLADVETELKLKKTALDNIQKQKSAIEQALLTSGQQIEKNEASLATLQQQAEDYSSRKIELDEQQKNYVEKRNTQNQQLEEWKSAVKEQRHKSHESETSLNQYRHQWEVLKQAIGRDQQQLQALETQRQRLVQYLSSKENPLDDLESLFEEHGEQQTTLEAAVQTLKKQLGLLNSERAELDRERVQLQTDLNEKQTKLQELHLQEQAVRVRQATLQEQLKGLGYECATVLAELPESIDLSESEQKWQSISEEIKRMGAINLMAIEEYQETSERKQYLDKQHEDLIEAMGILNEAIQKIDHETRVKFRDVYERVNEKFTALFPHIFGGGSATLTMVDGNLLTSGISIQAQPPGKKNSSVHLLSGGEKALTALALVFSLFHLNPAPFCILDEVDAPLDDVNVNRFTRLVREMSQQTQFLVISHNKNTIEMADQLIGVTMQELGVSRIVSVDIQEAVKMALAG